ncbi:MAG TPA: cupin domain-containing protein [Edaphobacter sp.]
MATTAPQIHRLLCHKNFDLYGPPHCSPKTHSYTLSFLMSPPTIASPLAGNVLGSVNDSFAIAEWRDAGAPPGPPRYIAPLHLHHNDDEAWYVLEGKLHVKRGPEVIEARAGSAVLVPRGTPHTYWNPDNQPVRYLLVMTPNIYRLIQEIHVMKDRSPAALRDVFDKHNSELLDS